MILDTLANAQRYHVLGPKFVKAFQFLAAPETAALTKGKYEIDGTDIFAIVNEYDTIDITGEQMESHKKYIDIQYMVSGEEQIGHDFLVSQTPSKAYDTEKDFMLFAEKPSFFTRLAQGTFAIFFPTDLHMPNLKVDASIPVKKIVIKVSV